MSRLDAWVGRWSPVMVACLLVGVIALVLAVNRDRDQAFEEFKELCSDSGGRALAYARGADLCVDEDGRIIITR